MNRLILALAGTIALSACSNTRDRSLPPGESSASRPDLTLPDSSALAARGERPVSPVEQQVARSPEKKTTAPTPAVPQRGGEAPRPGCTPRDTVRRGYAPPVASQPAPVPDSPESAGTLAEHVEGHGKEEKVYGRGWIRSLRLLTPRAQNPTRSRQRPPTPFRTACQPTLLRHPDTMSARASDSTTASNTASSTAGMSEAPSSAARRGPFR